MFTIECDRCGKTMTARNEIEAERLFDAHVCKGLRNLDDMPFDLLRKVVYDELTEDEAWTLADVRA
jgi:hypothetical protein